MFIKLELTNVPFNKVIINTDEISSIESINEPWDNSLVIMKNGLRYSVKNSLNEFSQLFNNMEG